MYGELKILISQPEPADNKSPYYEIAEKFQVEVQFRPFMKVERVSVKEFRQQRINILDFTAIIFTSRTAVDNFFSICEELRITVPDTMKYFCISERVALYLQKYIVYRKRKIFFSPTGKIEGLSAYLAKHAKENFFCLFLISITAKLLVFLTRRKSITQKVSCIVQ